MPTQSTFARYHDDYTSTNYFDSRNRLQLLGAFSKMSALGPIDPSSVQNEDQKEAAWIVRKLAGVSQFCLLNIKDG